MPYKLLPVKTDASLFYRLDSEAAERHGAIGYMRADFGKSGHEFWTTWFDVQPNLNIPVFKNEFGEIINSLRNDGNKPPFASRNNLSAYCFENPGDDFGERGRGYMIRTLNYSYYFRCNPRPGDYDIYCFVYDNRRHLQEAEKWQLPMKLRDLLEKLNDNPKDVDLHHWDCDGDSATMVDLSLKDFTEEGLAEFKTALDMEVVQVKDEDDTWILVWVKGANQSHVESLSLSHAGYCSAKDYNKWFTMDADEK